MSTSDSENSEEEKQPIYSIIGILYNGIKIKECDLIKDLLIFFPIFFLLFISLLSSFYI